MQPTLDDFAMRLIRNEARRLVGKFGFTRSDREDLEQDLTLEVLRRLQQIKGDVESPHAYMTTLIKRCVLNLVKCHTAPKRHQPKCQSLNDMIRGPDGRWVELGQTINEDRRLAHRGCEFHPKQDRQDLALDVATVLKSLPPHLQKAAKALMHGEPLTKVAVEAGVAPSTLRDTLRRHFEAAGISEFF